MSTHESSSYPLVQLKDLTVSNIDKRGPYEEDEFIYVDISSIDNKAKLIVAPKRLPVSEAPSRAKQRLQAGDVLVSMTRPNLNAVAIVPNELAGAIGSTGFHVLRAAEEVDPKWLYFGVQSHDFVSEMSGLVQGALYPAVRPKDINTFKLPAPPIDQQKRIVAEIEKQFSRLDEGIDNLKRVQANLKRYKAAVLKAAVEGSLVETEAEIARREGRDYETGEQLLQRILQERRRRWEEAELAKMQAKGKPPKNDKWKQKYKEPAAPDTTHLPELPEEWVWASLNSICEHVVDCPHSTPRFQANGRPCIDTTWMTPDGLVADRARYVDSETYEARITRLIPKPGDIVFAREGTIGTAVLVPQGMMPCLGQRVMLLRTSRLFSNAYLRYVLHSETVKQQYRKQALGSTVAHINVRDVKAFKVPVPPLAEQHRIVTEVDRRLSILRETEVQVEANLQRAERLRQSILAAAFSGRLVSDDSLDSVA